jgi:group I intron endonuclease
LRFIKIGVYEIFNKNNQKRYIGSSINIARRCCSHRHMLRHGKHKIKEFQNDWNLYGEGSFEFHVIKLCEANDTEKEEQFIIDTYNFNNLYNLRKYVQSSENYPSLFIGEKNHFFGKKHTEETKEKISTYTRTEKQIETAKENGRKNGGTKYFTEETYLKLKGQKQGEKSPTSKLKEQDVIEILKLLKNKTPYKEIIKIFPVEISEISRIKHRIRWGYLYETFPDLYRKEN